MKSPAKSFQDLLVWKKSHQFDNYKTLNIFQGGRFVGWVAFGWKEKKGTPPESLKRMLCIDREVFIYDFTAPVSCS